MTDRLEAIRNALSINVEGGTDRVTFSIFGEKLTWAVQTIEAADELAKTADAFKRKYIESLRQSSAGDKEWEAMFVALRAYLRIREGGEK